MKLKSIGKRPFYIMKCGHIPEKITGYVYATERNFYGIDKRNGYEWLITDIFTGALVGDAETRKEALAKITADLDDFLARAHSMEYCRKDMETLAELNGAEPELTEKPEKKTRREIKTRTYNNFMRVMRAVMAKGYDKETAETITRGIFDKYEANPRGLSVWGLFDLVAETTAEAPAAGSQTGETTTDEETPAETETSPQEATKRPYKTAEEITAAFISDGWENPHFTEAPPEIFSKYAPRKSRKLFIMTETGNIYNDFGEIVLYNLTEKPKTAPAETPAEGSQRDETSADEETPTTTETAPQKGAEAQNRTAASEAPEKAPRTNEKPEAIQNSTRGNKSPSRGTEKPHKGKGRGQHSPRPKPPRPERVFGFQGERVFGTQKMPLSYRGIPPGG